jgi:hypothetical protein
LATPEWFLSSQSFHFVNKYLVFFIFRILLHTNTHLVVRSQYLFSYEFARNDVWTLVPRPVDHDIIGTKWIFKNKLDEHGIVVRNKARLVA